MFVTPKRVEREEEGGRPVNIFSLDERHLSAIDRADRAQRTRERARVSLGNAFALVQRIALNSRRRGYLVITLRAGLSTRVIGA